MFYRWEFRDEETAFAFREMGWNRRVREQAFDGNASTLNGSTSSVLQNSAYSYPSGMMSHA
jgi:hypothetical protein